MVEHQFGMVKSQHFTFGMVKTLYFDRWLTSHYPSSLQGFNHPKLVLHQDSTGCGSAERWPFRAAAVLNRSDASGRFSSHIEAFAIRYDMTYMWHIYDIYIWHNIYICICIYDMTSLKATLSPDCFSCRYIHKLNSLEWDFMRLWLHHAGKLLGASGNPGLLQAMWSKTLGFSARTIWYIDHRCISYYLHIIRSYYIHHMYI
jgi:hypothetical protein